MYQEQQGLEKWGICGGGSSVPSRLGTDLWQAGNVCSKKGKDFPLTPTKASLGFFLSWKIDSTWPPEASSLLPLFSCFPT